MLNIDKLQNVPSGSNKVKSKVDKLYWKIRNYSS